MRQGGRDVEPAAGVVGVEEEGGRKGAGVVAAEEEKRWDWGVETGGIMVGMAEGGRGGRG